MNFKKQWCIACSDLDYQEMTSLLAKLFKEGYNLGESLDNFLVFLKWGYIGVNDKGDILLFSDNCSYINIDTEPFFNIYNRTQIQEYLSQ